MTWLGHLAMAQEQPVRVGRRLAAIVAADVAGYSRLMGLDEVGTARTLREHRKVTDALVAKHGGRLVKTTGDGVLLEFSSVVDAVECAVAVQAVMAQRNEGVPQDRRMLLRIGINLGDILIEGDDILGDGVNVAARLEGIAEPGGICISSSAYEQVRGKVPVEFTDLGEQNLKNIALPVRAYAVAHEGSRPHSVAGNAPASAISVPRLSIVVLPFVNLSGDPEQQYLADVLTENLTTGLARIHGTFVIARSTAFTYKGKPIDVKQVGKELGVRYALEGSEQHSRDKIRVTAQLIDVASGAHLWADQFNAPRSDLFEAEDQIVRRIARSLQIQLIAADLARASRSRPNNPDAQDLALRCRAAFYNVNFADPRNLIAACERSLQADGQDVFALSILGLMFALSVIMAQSVEPQADLDKADELISQALALDADSDIAHIAKSWMLMGRNRHEQAISEAERALALNPSHMETYSALCGANNYLGQPDQAIDFANEAIRLSPRDPTLNIFHHHKGWAFFMKERYEPAIDWLRRAEHVVPFTDLLLASALALTGRSAEAKKTLDRYRAYPVVKTTTIAQLRMQQFALADNPEWIAYNERLFDGYYARPACRRVECSPRQGKPPLGKHFRVTARPLSPHRSP
jgi:adenylate cyclase